MALPMDAVCVHAKCGKSGRDFYMMYYKSYDNKWVLTYGKKDLPHDSGSSVGTGSVSVDLTPMRTGPQYKCPHCGEKYTFICWNCGKKTCYDGDDHDGREVTCAHCGKSGVFRSKPSGSGGSGGKSKETLGISVNGQR